MGQETFEVTAPGSQFENGDWLGTWNIIRHSDVYERRQTYEIRPKGKYKIQV